MKDKILNLLMRLEIKIATIADEIPTTLLTGSDLVTLKNVLEKVADEVQDLHVLLEKCLGEEFIVSDVKS